MQSNLLLSVRYRTHWQSPRITKTHLFGKHVPVQQFESLLKKDFAIDDKAYGDVRFVEVRQLHVTSGLEQRIYKDRWPKWVNFCPSLSIEPSVCHTIIGR